MIVQSCKSDRVFEDTLLLIPHRSHFFFSSSFLLCWFFLLTPYGDKRKLAKEAASRGEAIDESIPIEKELLSSGGGGGAAELGEEDERRQQGKGSKRGANKDEDEFVDDLDVVAPEGFFERAPAQPKVSSFSGLNLSRPLLALLESLRWKEPTPVQVG